MTGELPLGELAGGAGELIGREPLGAGTETTGVDSVVAGIVSVSVTGHTVVETGIVEVTTEKELAGQSVTVGAQLVMVYSLVE